VARPIVVDTNVVVYHLLGDEQQSTEAGRVFHRDAELLAPASWRAELLSALWQAQRQKLCSLEDGLSLLEAAAGLVGKSVPVEALWREALAGAVAFDCSPYDTLFVVLAEREGCPLVSFDAALRRKFPAVVRRPAELLA
jgi:predicted nucleic acid-binding protein